MIIKLMNTKNDKINYNYKGISLLNTTYKVFSKGLLTILQPFADKCIEGYQRCFQKVKSTIDLLFLNG